MKNLKIERFIYEPSLLEKALSPSEIQIPGRGFHSLWEREFYIDGVDGTHIVLVAYVEGGLHCGDKYTVVLERKYDRTTFKYPIYRTGWAEGFTLPVPARNLAACGISARTFRKLKSQKLLFIDEVPGFTEGMDGRYYHPPGMWYSRSLLVREYPPLPILGEGARVFLLREGVYVYFPDESFRLIPYAEYFDLESWPVPDYRQGDLLVWKVRDVALTGHKKTGEEVDEILLTCDRHTIIVVPPAFYSPGENWTTGGRIEHPEHGVLELPGPETLDPGVGYVPKYSWKLLPGTSRPFQRGGRMD